MIIYRFQSCSDLFSHFSQCHFFPWNRFWKGPVSQKNNTFPTGHLSESLIFLRKNKEYERVQWTLPSLPDICQNHWYSLGNINDSVHSQKLDILATGPFAESLIFPREYQRFCEFQWKYGIAGIPYKTWRLRPFLALGGHRTHFYGRALMMWLMTWHMACHTT